MTCEQSVAMLSYANDVVADFPSAYEFSSSDVILDQNGHVVASNYSRLLSQLFDGSYPTPFWSGTANGGTLTSQNCFDWALDLNCLYGTLSNQTNVRCDNKLPVYCFCVRGNYKTSAPTLSPTPSFELPLVLPGTSRRRRRLSNSTSAPTVSKSILNSLFGASLSRPDLFVTAYTPSHLGRYDLDSRLFTPGSSDCIFEQVANAAGFYLINQPIGATKEFILLPGSGNATGYSVTAKKVLGGLYTLNDVNGPYYFFDSTDPFAISTRDCSVDWYISFAPTQSPT